jgi:hypothetical protein
VHRHAAASTTDGWQAVEMDLEQLDTESVTRAEQREAASADQPASRSSGRRHSRRRRSARSRRAQSSEFNRRLQLVLFVTLLLVGVVVMMRTCSGGSRRVEPEAAPVGGHAGLVRPPNSP